MKKAIYILAGLLLVFASADATGRQQKARIELVYQPGDNGDYRLFLFGGERVLVCEEKAIRIVQQGDAVNPLVIECSHGGK